MQTGAGKPKSPTELSGYRGKLGANCAMLLKLAQYLYWLTTILAIALVVTAAALALDLNETDGFELYVVCTAMVAVALAIGLFGHAVFRMAR